MTIDSSSGDRAFDDDAVDRNLFAGPNAQAVADGDSVERNVFVAAVVA